MPRMDSFGLGRSKMLKCKRHNIEFVFSVFCPPRIPPKQKEEQMENSSPSHGYFPAGKFRYPASRRHAPALRSSKYSLLTLLFHLRHPNSKTNQPKFWQILSPKNSFCKTSSALFRHLPEYLEDRTPKEKYPFLFQKKFHPRQIKKARNIFLWCCRVKRGSGGTIRAYEAVSSYHARGACD